MTIPWVRINANIDWHPLVKKGRFWASTIFQAIIRIAKENGKDGGHVTACYVTFDYLVDRLSLHGEVPNPHSCVEAGLRRAIEVGLLESDGEGGVIIKDWKQWQLDPTSAERQRKYRERKARDVEVSVDEPVTERNATSRNVTVTNGYDRNCDGTGRDVTGRDIERNLPPRKRGPRHGSSVEPKDAPPSQRAIALWVDLMSEQRGVSSATVPGKSAAAAKRFVSGKEWTDIEAAVRGLVGDEDPWVKNHGWALWLIEDRGAKYIADSRAKRENPHGIRNPLPKVPETY